MTEQYLQIMIESLEKKLQVMDKVMELDKRQFDLSVLQPVDMEAYDATMDEKGLLIDELNKLDDGFTSTYNLVKEEVQANPQKYKDKVLVMQELIRQAVEKSVTIQAQEQRNKQAIQSVFAKKRQEIHRKRISSSAATKYYKAMSRINDVDPQLMDKKK